MADRFDEALKSFVLWQGVAHCIMIGYALLLAYMLWTGFQLGANLTTQQTALITVMTGVLPVMTNWYTGVMQALYARAFAKGE